MAKPKPGLRAAERDTIEEPGEAGPGQAQGMPYTVFFPVDGTLRPADLEHVAPLPRVGDVVEYIDERSLCRRYVVAEVIHTLQSSAAHRPRVRDERLPNAFAREEADSGEAPGDGGSLRAGLPKVILREAPGGGETEESGFRVRRGEPGGEEEQHG